MEEKETMAAETWPDESQQAGEAGIETLSDGLETAIPVEVVSAEDLLEGSEQPVTIEDKSAANLKAVLEAVIYVLDEPMPAAQIADALGLEKKEVEAVLRELAEETLQAGRGLFIREVAGGYQMATKPEHHEVLRQFVKNLKQPLKLSQAALETLAVIAYKQPITLPEILEIRGVQGGGVLKTLIDRKLITTAGRKQVIGRPMLYKTTKEFLTQFGLKDVGELPSLKEFEEIRRQSLADEEFAAAEPSETEPRSGPVSEVPEGIESEADPSEETANGAGAEAEADSPAADVAEENETSESNG